MNYLELSKALGFMGARSEMHGWETLVNDGSPLQSLAYFKFAKECRDFQTSISDNVSTEIQDL